MKRKLKQLKEDGKTAADSKEDHNYIMRQIIMNYAFRVLRLIVIIFSISYFIATLWYIFTWAIDDDVSPGYFFGVYKFREMRA